MLPKVLLIVRLVACKFNKQMCFSIHPGFQLTVVSRTSIAVWGGGCLQLWRFPFIEIQQS